jgi:hypothetical protein
MARAGRGALRVLLTVLASATPARAQGGGDANRGRALFTGATPLRNGGPACIACHDEVALGVPGGGTMGPDLTNVAARMGTLGVATALETLFFPTMAPLFSAHPLTVDERTDLAAFLGTRTPANPNRQSFVTIGIGVAAVVLGAIFLAITALTGRSRVRSVRLAMLARTLAARKAAP